MNLLPSKSVVIEEGFEINWELIYKFTIDEFNPENINAN
jgi:hypothetical protein